MDLDGPDASDFVEHLLQLLVSDFRIVHSSDGKIHTGEPLDYQIAITMGFAFESVKTKSRERSRLGSMR